MDVTPTLETVLSFADMLTAEAESLAISELQPAPEVKPVAAPTTKVKAMTAMFEDKGEKGTGKGRLDGKPEEMICRLWGTEDGYRKGQECRFKHEWGGLDKKGRCFGCSATGHSKKDCPASKPKGKDQLEKQAVKSIKEKGIAAPAKGEAVEAGPKSGGSDLTDHNQANEGDKGAGSTGEMKDVERGYYTAEEPQAESIGEGHPSGGARGRKSPLGRRSDTLFEEDILRGGMGEGSGGECGVGCGVSSSEASSLDEDFVDQGRRPDLPWL